MRRHAFLFGALVLTHGSLSYGAYAQQADKCLASVWPKFTGDVAALPGIPPGSP